MAKQPTKKLRATAYHEAGHAVAHIQLRQPFQYATIIPREGSLGHIGEKNLDHRFEQGSGLVHRAKVESQIIICWAGPYAQYKYLHKRPPSSNSISSGWGTDLNNLMGMTGYETGSPEETQAYIEWLRLRAWNLVNAPLSWLQIEAVATELIRRRQCSARLCRRVAREAMLRAISRHDPPFPPGQSHPQ